MGSIIGNGRIRADPEKCRILENYAHPATVKEMRSFLGLANFVRDYIPDFASIARPLYKSFEGETKRSIRSIKWDEQKYKSFDMLRNKISKMTYRALPDFTKESILICNASNYALGSILAQKPKMVKRKW